MGNLDLLRKEVDDKPKLGDNIQIARNGCDLLLNIINNVLDASKIESNEMDIHYTSTNVKRFFEDHWKLYSSIIRE